MGNDAGRQVGRHHTLPCELSHESVPLGTVTT